MNINAMSLGPIGTNCYIVSEKNAALIIDPGGDADTIIDYLTENDWSPLAILLTHAHFDHIGAVDTIRNYYNIDVYVHHKEAKWLSDGELNGSQLLMGTDIITGKPDEFLIPGEMTIGEFHFNVLHTPGHSPGSVSFVFDDYSYVIGGDALFNKGIGRTDLFGGDFSRLQNSIKTVLYTLPDHYTVYPGHGPLTKIKDEKDSNPFVKG